MIKDAISHELSDLLNYIERVVAEVLKRFLGIVDTRSKKAFVTVLLLGCQIRVLARIVVDYGACQITVPVGLRALQKVLDVDVCIRKRIAAKHDCLLYTS